MTFRVVYGYQRYWIPTIFAMLTYSPDVCMSSECEYSLLHTNIGLLEVKSASVGISVQPLPTSTAFIGRLSCVRVLRLEFSIAVGVVWIEDWVDTAVRRRVSQFFLLRDFAKTQPSSIDVSVDLYKLYISLSIPTIIHVVHRVYLVHEIFQNKRRNGVYSRLIPFLYRQQ